MLYRKKVFVLMRYSILSKDVARSWKIGQSSLDEYRKSLFDTERLNLHERIFFDLTFKSILKASEAIDYEFTFIMFISSELPRAYKDRIYTLASKFEFFLIKELGVDEKTLPSIDKEVLKNLSESNEDTLYATVRLDDDDAIHPEFLLNLDKLLTLENIGYGISFSCGYSGMFDGTKFSSFHRMNAINNAQGQAVISFRKADGEVSDAVSVFSPRISHSRLHWAIPVRVDGRKPMYIRTVHEHGDFYSEDYKNKMSRPESVDKNAVIDEFLLDPKLVR